MAAPAVAPDYTVGGKYRLKRKIAEGGMGAVWAARHEVLDVDVAVKVMSADMAGKELALSRFEREAKASAQLKSHHVVRVHDYGMDDGMPFMVMELLEGEDLGVRLKRDGPMTVAEFAPIFAQICKGLEVAHDAGFVHRDLKPSNIFMAREGEDEVVKIVDFGVAFETKTKLVDDKTSSGVVVGSPHHMSPEQAHGEAVDHRSDLWSLGVLVFRMLTGEKPFKGEIMTAILLAVVSHPIPDATDVNSDLPEDVNRFLQHALTRSADARFQRARTMGAALTAIAEGADLTPFLNEDPYDEDGREDMTVPSGARVSVVPPPRTTEATESSAGRSMATRERTPSKTVGAVTAGVIAASGVQKKARVWPYLALAAGLALVAFFLGRSGTENPARTGVETTAAAVAPGSPAPSEQEATTTSAPKTPTPKAPSTGEPSPSSSVPATGPSSVSKPPQGHPPQPNPPQPNRYQPPVRKPPPTKPQPRPTDPFTGLPI